MSPKGRPRARITRALNNPQQQLTRQQLLAVRQEISGPLPSADELERYAALVPDMPERLLASWERQTEHRIDLERKVIAGDIWRSNWGLRLGWIFAMSLLAAAVYLISTGHESQGVLTLLTTLGGMAGLFVYQDIRRRAERNRKQ